MAFVAFGWGGAETERESAVETPEMRTWKILARKQPTNANFIIRLLKSCQDTGFKKGSRRVHVARRLCQDYSPT